VVVVLGGEPELVAALGRAANVRAWRGAPGGPLLERAVDAWSAARETRSTYFVHDADPLAAVTEAWARRFEGTGPAGELEVVVAETLARWRTGSLELPDYYVLVTPEQWAPTPRHFHLGFLSAQAPSRVEVTEPGRIAETIGGLRAGRWWPDLDDLLRGIDLVVPDQAGLAAAPKNDRPAGAALLGAPTLTAVTDGRMGGARG